MAIEQIGSLANRLNTSLDKDKKARKSSSSSSTKKKTKFSSIIKEAITQREQEFSISSKSARKATEDLERLLDDVHQSGEALRQDPVFGPLKSYKNAVRRFISYIIENGMESEEQFGILNTRSMQRKKYRVIRIIDEKLESLATHLVKNQREQMDILARIDEINGLLVNLMR